MNLRRIVPLALLLPLIATGCVAVSSKNNRFAQPRTAVVLNNRVYLVDTRDGTLYELDPAKARPFVPPCGDEVEVK